ncbi:mechanosensitive ion channel family protein [Patescibacteria group bacterium]|nr:mechanosensitive ion channel family protein [Patescibacteria group bacterium]
MADFINNLNLELVVNILRSVLTFIILFWLFNFLLRIAKRGFLRRVKTKKERSNIEIFFRAAQYLIFLLIIIFAFLSYAGSLAGIGIAAGFLTAALGWALQRPITGIAAWLMMVIKRPFEIGDRIIIGQTKGDVVDITLTHIHIGEIGGTIAAEENSGRIILVPNAKLFDEDIINYTKTGETILDEVKFAITFESNLKKAKEIASLAAKKVLKNFVENMKEPYLRIWFQASGVDVLVRYFTPAVSREEIRSLITQEIFKNVRSLKDVEFAYPHTEVLLRKK